MRLETVAELALQRKVGARGLRMILEDLMLELMLSPADAAAKGERVVVTAEMVRGHEINGVCSKRQGDRRLSMEPLRKK